MNKFSRLLLILDLLPRYPSKKTANQLYELILETGNHTCVRTIQRDLKSLQELDVLGVDYDSRERPYGWYRINTWRPSPSNQMNMDTALSYSLLIACNNSMVNSVYLKPLATELLLAKQTLRSRINKISGLPISSNKDILATLLVAFFNKITIELSVEQQFFSAQIIAIRQQEQALNIEVAAYDTTSIIPLKNIQTTKITI